MIKVNLLGDETVMDHSAKLWGLIYAASLGVTVFFCVFFYTWSSAKLSSLSSEKERLAAELETLKKTTEEVRDLEKKKDNLAGKLKVMATLKRSKPGPVKVLSDLNDSVPQRIWLTRAEERGGEMVIEGISLDNETIASFMQELEKSGFVGGVELDETKQVDEKGAKVKSFSVRAKIDYAGIFSEGLSEIDEKILADSK